MAHLITIGYAYWDGFKWITTPGTGGSTNIIGSGLWHESNSVLDPNAYIGSAGQFVVTNAGATDTSWVSISGDISASTTTPGKLTLVAIQGNSLPTPSGTNTVLTWTGSNLTWGSGGGSGSITLTKDVTGSGTGTVSTTVVNINSASVPTATSHAVGNTLFISSVAGSGSLNYGALNLAGGANYVTGTLPAGNIPNLAGDVTGSITSNTITSLQGHIVLASSPSTDGQLFMWNGANWGLTAAIPSPSTGNVLTWNGTNWAPAAGGGGGGFTPPTGNGFIHITSSLMDGTASTGTLGQFAVTNFVSGSSGPLDAKWYSMTGDLTPGTISGTSYPVVVSKIQTNPVSAVAPTAGQFLIENSPSATGSAWQSLTQDVTNSTTTSGKLTVVGIRTNPVSATPPTAGQFLIENAPSATGSAWTTLSGDVNDSSTTAGLLTVVGIQNVPVPAPIGSNVFLNYTAGTLSWTSAGGLSISGTGIVHVTSGSIDTTANLGGAGQVLTTNNVGTDTSWQSMAGDVIGQIPTSEVVGLRNRNIDTTSPSNGNVYVWNAASTSTWYPEAVDLSNTQGGNIQGILGIAHGGTGQTSNGTTGNLLTSNGSTTMTWLANGSAGQVLTISGGVPSWQNASGGAPAWLLGGNSSPSPATLGSTNATSWSLMYDGTTVQTCDNTDAIHYPIHNLIFTPTGTCYLGTNNTSSTLGFGTNGVESIVISASTNLVGIGTTPASTAQLFVQTQTAGITYGAIIENTNTTVTTSPSSVLSGVIRAITGATPNSSVSPHNAVYVDCWSSSASSHDGFLGAANPGTVALFNSSDRRIKENITPSVIGLETLEKINVCEFSRIQDTNKNRVLGFVAQELYEAFPRAVIKGSSDDEMPTPASMWYVNEAALIPVLVKGSQDLAAENRSLKSMLSKLEARLEKLEQAAK